MYFGGDERHQAGAERASKRALELDPELAEAHAARGLALSIGKRYVEAERELEAAIALNPGLFEAYYFYARACFAGGDRERAAQLFEKASRVNPHDYQAVALLGFVYRELGLDEQSEIANRRALQRIERHVELNPDDARAFYLGATARVDLGDREGGFEWAERALSMSPDDPYNVYGIACFYSRFGEQEEGLRLFETALRAGFSHRAWIDNDGDLDNIRSHPRFAELVKQYLS